MKVKCQAKKNQGSNTLVGRFAVVVREIPDTEFPIDDHTEKVDNERDIRDYKFRRADGLSSGSEPDGQGHMQLSWELF